MAMSVLIADDDQELLLVLKEGLEKYKDEFNVILAGDGQTAMRKMRNSQVSLVVADLKMPGIDGFSLLARISEQHPDIPVIVITAYGSQQIREMVKQNGAAGYLEKPFMIDDLIREIRDTLSREADGGTLHGISLAMFLQLIDMEQKTCTLRVSEKSTGKEGTLFFREGELLEARTGHQNGEEAAYTILSWDNTQISIQNSCNLKEKKINRDPQAILMDAMRLKDESQEIQEEEPELIEEDAVEDKVNTGQGLKAEISDSAVENTTRSPEEVLSRLESKMGEKSGIEDIYQEDAWDEFVQYGKRLGDVFEVGALKFGFIDHSSTGSKFILPGKPTTVISVRHTCPRENMIHVLRTE